MVDDYGFQRSFNTICYIYCFFVCGKNYRIGKRKQKITEKDEWELTAGIPLMPIVGVNHCLRILHLFKILVHIYTTENTINQFSIGYMINPSIHFNKVFKTQVQKCLGCSFSIKTIKTIKKCLMKNNTFIMELIMIYENNGKHKKTVYRVLSCVFYTLIDIYVCIDYLLCQ